MKYMYLVLRDGGAAASLPAAERAVVDHAATAAGRVVVIHATTSRSAAERAVMAAYAATSEADVVAERRMRDAQAAMAQAEALLMIKHDGKDERPPRANKTGERDKAIPWYRTVHSRAQSPGWDKHSSYMYSY